jgi:glycosyltransferase involved in cell wall biosynthesis
MHVADKVIAVSERIKDMIIRHYGIDPAKVVVVHNGSDPVLPVVSERYETLKDLKRDGKKIILYAGRITLQKGVDYFVHAAKKVLEYEKGVYFIVAGTGDMEEKIIKLTSDLGISDHFIFTGYYTLHDQQSMFTLADLVVMPSVSEPFGIIPLEAMSLGTPVIVSKQSGVAEIITHALKMDFWDTDEMANNIIAVLRHQPLTNTLKNEGQNQSKGITWDVAAKKLKQLYQSLP